MSRSSVLSRRPNPRGALDRLLNRQVPSGWRIDLRSGWPLLFVPLLIFMQLLGPSPVWVALLICLVGLYAVSYAWVRNQVQQIYFERRREGSMLVVGDALQERFIVRNESALPLHWLEFADSSRLPGYNPRQVVSCGSGSSYQWRMEAQCTQRGVFRLGPHTLRTGDPFGLFGLEFADTRSESLLVYPRVAHIPDLDLPRGSSSGQDRRRRTYSGSERAQSVRAYQPGDSLRHVHWPISARQGELIVTDVETEPSGDLWIVLDVHRLVQSGKAENSTLETSIVLAASVAAEFLGGGERRSVGLLAASGAEMPTLELDWQGDAIDERTPTAGPSEGANGIISGNGQMSLGDASQSLLIDVPPQPGKGQVWRILAALAPVQEGDLSLHELLRRGRGIFTAGQTVLAITSDIGEGVQNWTAELLHLRHAGVPASVIAVTPAHTIAEETLDNGEVSVDEQPRPDPGDPSIHELLTHLSDAAPNRFSAASQASLVDILARYEIPLRFMQAGARLTPALTYRRTRTILRTTPSGGVVVHEVEEDVG
ncbi:MAG: DUF58 domain-containing protein [Caldilineaceae bacterium]|uniref:DUF58 domain-containing protein n=1 Tax=Caldilineaceae bacterium SB0675_bin_29 TaxID=2605266 RepID=A0A6B1G499_9CHLR|nr:DUF58 domain-containing protein [Caldilineaceae bacterium]MYH63138.1 DUF58 domain-containing protein [Caldilineaceae bacterium SB0675_bin_29]